MATTKAEKAKATKAEDRSKDPSFPYKGDREDVPQGASKPAGEKVSMVSGGGEPSEAPLTDIHDIAYRDRDPGTVGGTGTVAGAAPGKRVTTSEDGKFGTLVENIPDMREENRRSTMNAADPAPEKVAKQPGETDEAYAARTKGK